jgi:adiponectin receptor
MMPICIFECLLADNEAIRTHYRYGLSRRQAFFSLFRFHNETMNVWTHLIGGVTFLVLLLHVATVDKVSLGHMPLQPMRSLSGVYGNVPTVGVDSAGVHVFDELRDDLRQHRDTFVEAISGTGFEHAQVMQSAAGELYEGASAAIADFNSTGLVSSWNDTASAVRESFAASLQSLLKSVNPRVLQTTRQALEQIEQVVTDIQADFQSQLNTLQSALPKVDDGHSAPIASGIDLQVPTIPAWPMLVFLGSAVFLLLSSAMFHLLHVVSEKLFEQLARLDYAAISVLIAGSAFPTLYYAFWCMPSLQKLYVSLCVLSCAITMYVGLSDKFRSSEWRLMRMTAFIATGAYGLLPLTHLMLSSERQHTEGLIGLGTMGFLYISGALLYGFRIPERFFPGRFDVVLSSHQIFHVCVFCACLVHYYTTVDHFVWRSRNALCSPAGTEA